MVREIHPVELKEKLDQGEDLLVLDVREKEEYEIANIGGKLIPLSELPNRLTELSTEQHIVVMCHHGMRSAQAAEFLRKSGFLKIQNLSGGIDRWADEVDPELPRY